MQDRPTARELLAAVREFISQEIVPVSSNPRLKFRLLIAANVLNIVERELTDEESRLREEYSRLTALDGSAAETEVPKTVDKLRAAIQKRTRTLCTRIRAGEADAGPWRREVLNYARWSVREKLLVANPRFIERVESTVSQG